MEDMYARAMIKQAKNDLSSKIKIYTYTVSSSGVSTITYDLDYSPTTDELIIEYNGIRLYENQNYTMNTLDKSIHLTDWTLNSVDIVNFTLYKNIK